MPETDSAICAVRAAIVSRTRRNAEWDFTWNVRVRTTAGRQDHERDAAEPPVEDEEAADRCHQRQRVHDEGGQPL